MASTAVVLGTFSIIGLFILHIVGLATPHWYGFTLQSIEILYAGLFKVCFSTSFAGSTALGDKLCFDYADKELTSADYYGFTGFTCLAGLLYFIASIMGLIGCCNSSRPGRSTVQNLSGMAFGAGGCSLAGIIWFAARFYNDVDNFNSLVTVTQSVIELQYSFYLCAVSGGLCIAFAITMCIVGQNMQTPAVAGVGIVNPVGPQVTVVHSQMQHQPGVYQPGVYQPPMLQTNQQITAVPI